MVVTVAVVDCVVVLNTLMRDDTCEDVVILEEILFPWAPPPGPTGAAIVATCLKPEFHLIRFMRKIS